MEQLWKPAEGETVKEGNTAIERPSILTVLVTF